MLLLRIGSDCPSALLMHGRLMLSVCCLSRSVSL